MQLLQKLRIDALRQCLLVTLCWTRLFLAPHAKENEYRTLRFPLEFTPPTLGVFTARVLSVQCSQSMGQY